MIVVADATPLRYLVIIDAIDVLPTLYERVYIPQRVADELQRPRTPLAVRQWMATPPTWLAKRVPQQVPDVLLFRLDPGERDGLIRPDLGDGMLCGYHRGHGEAGGGPSKIQECRKGQGIGRVYEGSDALYSERGDARGEEKMFARGQGRQNGASHDDVYRAKAKGSWGGATSVKVAPPSRV